MGTFLVYVLKSALCLAAFCLCYRWLLSKETFHRSNRLTLLTIGVFSWLVPLMEITAGEMTGVGKAIWSLEEWLLMAGMNQDVAFTGKTMPVPFWLEVVGCIYILGSFGFFFLQVYSLSKMYRLLCNSREKRLANGVRLLVHTKNVSPFSWMHWVVVAEKDLAENGSAILAHECAHVRYRHSWDLLLADVCILFQWFNPAAWLLKQELRHVHEYEADASVVRQGIDAKDYQLLLIKKAAGTRLYSMANSLNHSSLKKRITMMIKKKSNPWARLKYLYVLPVAAIAITAFARPEISERMNGISSVKVNELTSNAKAKEGKNDEKLDIVGEVPSTEVKKGMALSRKQPLVLVDGIKKTWPDVSSIHPETIESMYIWKGEEAVSKYGEAGKNGVIEIKLKRGGF